MYLTHDETIDAAYVYFTKREIAHTVEVREGLHVDYDVDGLPVGVEFLDVSDGVDLDDDVPHFEEVARLFEDHGLPVRVAA